MKFSFFSYEMFMELTIFITYDSGNFISFIFIVLQHIFIFY